MKGGFTMYLLKSRDLGHINTKRQVPSYEQIKNFSAYRLNPQRYECSEQLYPYKNL